MKFTLKASLDNPQELAKFIQDLEIEIDMPFLKNSSDETVKELCEKFVYADEVIKILQSEKEELIRQNNEMFEQLSKTTETSVTSPVPSFQSPTPSSPAEINDAETASATFSPAEPYSANPKKEHKSPFANLKPISCQTCGLEFVPNHNRVKWCPKCKAAKTAPSKKVKKLHQASD